MLSKGKGAWQRTTKGEEMRSVNNQIWMNLTHLIKPALLLLLSRSVVSDSVRPHRRQLTRFLCPWDSPGKNTGVGCHFLLQCIKVKSESEVAQSCPTLSNPMDWSLPGSSVHGIFQARVLEWGAVAFSENQPWKKSNGKSLLRSLSSLIQLTVCPGRLIMWLRQLLFLS